MIETISELCIVSQTVQDRIIEEVTILTGILEITVENLIQTLFKQSSNKR